MLKPKDDNLRLIGAEEEARYIHDRYRSARNTSAVAAVLAFAGLCLFFVFNLMWKDTDFWLELGAGMQAAVLLFMLLTPMFCLFAIFYGVRALRYVWYRREHRDFLRKYNRTYPTLK